MSDAWIIQRTAPQEPVSYWGRCNRWLRRPVPSRPADLLAPAVPKNACRYGDFDVALAIAEWLRRESTAWGEVIAVIPAPETPA